jgi:hypothetical protein
MCLFSRFCKFVYPVLLVFFHLESRSKTYLHKTLYQKITLDPKYLQSDFCLALKNEANTYCIIVSMLSLSLALLLIPYQANSSLSFILIYMVH